MKNVDKEKVKQLPSVDKIVNAAELKNYKEQLNYDVLKKIVRESLSLLRKEILAGRDCNTDILQFIKMRIERYLKLPLKKVINCTGVVLNTNLGRAPLGETLLSSIHPLLEGYNNLEFDLEQGKRGSRNKHLHGLMKLLTGCEDSVVVNNNAAAVFLALKTHCEGMQVIVSRGELVEIGGSFRIPEIIAGSGAKLVEVGTTNKTKLSDYENAITEDTAAILKVHKSNYFIAGFTEEVSVKELSLLAKKYGIMTIFDLGTGLVDTALLPDKIDEPDIKSSMGSGADIITFSCDKLLGGPQAGIIAGRTEFVSSMAKHPLMRILRVDKMILAALSYTLRMLMFNDSFIKEKVPLFKYLNRDIAELNRLAGLLVSGLQSQKIEAFVVDNEARCGGGTLPDYVKKSKAVVIDIPKLFTYKSSFCDPAENKSNKAEIFYHKLLEREIPVIAILREGNIMFDMLTVTEEDIPLIIEAFGRIIA